MMRVVLPLLYLEILLFLLMMILQALWPLELRDVLREGLLLLLLQELLILLHPLHSRCDAGQDVLMEHVHCLSKGPVLDLHHRHALQGFKAREVLLHAPHALQLLLQRQAR